MEEGLLYGKSSGGGGNLLWGNVYSMKPVSADGICRCCENKTTRCEERRSLLNLLKNTIWL
jgi:hypothetical protein